MTVEVKVSTSRDGFFKGVSPVDRARIFVGSGLGSGFLRPASGTWGSGLAVLLYLPVAAHVPNLAVWGAVILVTYLVGVWSCSAWDRLTGEKDSHDIVIDEFVGQWIALAPVPLTLGHGGAVLWGWSAASLFFLVPAALVLFRIFDITKLPPIRHLERLPGGWGVMTDDVLAGIFAALSMWFGLWGWNALL